MTFVNAGAAFRISISLVLVIRFSYFSNVLLFGLKLAAQSLKTYSVFLYLVQQNIHSLVSANILAARA